MISLTAKQLHYLGGKPGLIAGMFSKELKQLGINPDAAKQKTGDMFGEITLDHLDQVDQVMKIYIDLYKKFRYVEQSRPYVKTPKPKEDKEYFEDDEIKINQEEYNDPEDYLGI